MGGYFRGDFFHWGFISYLNLSGGFFPWGFDILGDSVPKKHAQLADLGCLSQI